MNPTQCRMARAALGLSIPDLAAMTKTPDKGPLRAATISHFEKGRESYASTVRRLQAALEAAGVVFVGAGEASLSGGAGVRIKGD